MTKKKPTNTEIARLKRENAELREMLRKAYPDASPAAPTVARSSTTKRGRGQGDGRSPTTVGRCCRACRGQSTRNEL